jgi:hypothetical protein
VIQFIAAEYTGPLHFVQFWLDVIKQWEKETGNKEIIGLSTTKDVQDSVLADPARAAVVDLIDIRYWHYQEDGTVYAPKGGQNLAPRQHARLLKPKRTSFEQVYRAVSEYKQKFPNKAVIYSGDSYDQFGWATFMAGGSLASLPPLDKDFLSDASTMKSIKSDNKDQWILTDGNGWILTNGKRYIVYLEKMSSLKMNLLSPEYKVDCIEPKSGKATSSFAIASFSGGQIPQINNIGMPVVLWIRPK